MCIKYIYFLQTILTKLSENGFRLKAITVEKYECVLCKEECKSKEDLGVHLVKHKGNSSVCLNVSRFIWVQITTLKLLKEGSDDKIPLTLSFRPYLSFN